MVKKITDKSSILTGGIPRLDKNNKELYQCEECGMSYENNEWALKCEAWCREHKSCNLEIIKHAVPRG